MCVAAVGSFPTHTPPCTPFCTSFAPLRAGVHIFPVNGSRLSRFIAIRQAESRISAAEGRFMAATTFRDFVLRIFGDVLEKLSYN